MCDTFCAVGRERTLFAKNSDRPVAEAQVTEPHAVRRGGGRLRATYIEVDDAGAAALLGSRPVWMWGLEHGVNEHRVAIGNEKIWTVDDPHAVAPALLGMDLVRLGLERGRSATDALDAMTALLERHGQGGSGEQGHDEPYWSSFLVADPTGGWVLETSGRTWAARPVDDGASISNRVTLGTDWSRASPDVPPGADFDRWRDARMPTGIADHRLDATRACVATGASALTPADVVATLRHHGRRPWGAPGSDPADVSPLPDHTPGDGSGVTVCMHLPGYQVTTASIVTELPRDPSAAVRAWVAPGSPCVSVYVPVFPPDRVPGVLSHPATWERFAALRDRVESDASVLAEVRTVLAPVEAALWQEADAIAGEPDARARFVSSTWDRVEPALASLGV